MSRLFTRIGIGSVAAALVVPLGVITTAGPAHAVSPVGRGDAVGLVGGTTLIKFRLNRPGNAKRVARISGLTGGDTSLIGIDRRIQNNKIYGVGNNGGVYIIGQRGNAFPVNRLSVALEGSEFGVDFNPAANRLRIISDTGQNLRHDVSGSASPVTVADGPLTYPGAGGTSTPGTGVTAAAYTNNDLDENTATALFVIDTSQNQLAIQSPANAGTLAPIGKLRAATRTDAGYDIGKGNRGWATLAAAGGRYRLFSVDRGTGRATPRGAFPARLQPSDIAVPIR